MSKNNLVAGIKSLQINGTVVNVVGNVTYNLGLPKIDKLVGADRVHGSKQVPQVAFVECDLRTGSEMSRSDLINTREATVVLEVADGTSFMWEGADYCAKGDMGSEEGTIQSRFESQSQGEEITS